MYFRFVSLWWKLWHLRTYWCGSCFPIFFYENYYHKFDQGRCTCGDLTALDAGINWTWRLVIAWGMLKFMIENISVKIWSLIGPNIFVLPNADLVGRFSYVCEKLFGILFSLQSFLTSNEVEMTTYGLSVISTHLQLFYCGCKKYAEDWDEIPWKCFIAPAVSFVKWFMIKICHPYVAPTFS